MKVYLFIREGLQQWKISLEEDGKLIVDKNLEGLAKKAGVILTSFKKVIGSRLWKIGLFDQGHDFGICVENNKITITEKGVEKDGVIRHKQGIYQFVFQALVQSSKNSNTANYSIDCIESDLEDKIDKVKRAFFSMANVIDYINANEQDNLISHRLKRLGISLSFGKKGALLQHLREALLKDVIVNYSLTVVKNNGEKSEICTFDCKSQKLPWELLQDYLKEEETKFQQQKKQAVKDFIKNLNIKISLLVGSMLADITKGKSNRIAFELHEITEGEEEEYSFKLNLEGVDEGNIRVFSNFLNESIKNRIFAENLIFDTEIVNENVSLISECFRTVHDMYRCRISEKSVISLLHEINRFFLDKSSLTNGVETSYSFLLLINNEDKIEEVVISMLGLGKTLKLEEVNLNMVSSDKLVPIYILVKELERFKEKLEYIKEQENLFNEKEQAWGIWKAKFDEEYKLNFYLIFNRSLDHGLLEYVIHPLQYSLSGEEVIFYDIDERKLADIPKLFKKYQSVSVKWNFIIFNLVEVCQLVFKWRPKIEIISYQQIQLQCNDEEAEEFIRSVLPCEPNIYKGKILLDGHVSLSALQEKIEKLSARIKKLQNLLVQLKNGFESYRENSNGNIINELRIGFSSTLKNLFIFCVVVLDRQREVKDSIHKLSAIISHIGLRRSKECVNGLKIVLDDNREVEQILNQLKQFLFLNKKIDQIISDVQDNEENSTFFFDRIKNNKVLFRFSISDFVIFRKRNTPKNITLGDFDVDDRLISDIIPNAYESLSIPIGLIESNDFNITDYVNVVKTDFIKRIKEEIATKLPVDSCFVRYKINYDINRKETKQILVVNVGNYSNCKRLRAKTNNKETFIRNSNNGVEIKILLKEISKLTKEGKSVPIKFSERDINQELAILLGVLSCIVCGTVITAILVNFVNTKKTFIICGTICLFLDFALSGSVAMLFYIIRDEQVSSQLHDVSNLSNNNPCLYR
ncbi:MAG: hypothetical protein HRK26_01675 [Rickettsiaceae bacterium H1]|nr:hypothetical protein [Rickettsiaceae bacterium H1]